MDNKKRIFALGFFDGVHLGHQALLRECCRLAAEQGCQTAAITFEQHPMSIFLDNVPLLINTDSDREKLLRQYGIGPIYKFPVTREVMSTKWQAFLEELLEYGAAGFVCGDDFRFGDQGEGNAQKLKAFCAKQDLPCKIIPEQRLNGIRISSTYIRTLLECGDMEQAARFLGHPHIFTGMVVPGKHLGFPTANLVLPQGVQCPRYGVYACRVRIGSEEYPAVTNVGIRPTVGGENVTVEPWILGYEGNLYGREITVEFHKFLRPEQKFATLTDLQAEIRKNGEEALKFFGNT